MDAGVQNQIGVDGWVDRRSGNEKLDRNKIARQSQLSY